MRIPLLCFLESFLLTGEFAGRGALSRRLLALRHWPESQNRPARR
jgi:hypothetical protein